MTSLVESLLREFGRGGGGGSGGGGGGGGSGGGGVYGGGSSGNVGHLDPFMSMLLTIVLVSLFAAMIGVILIQGLKRQFPSVRPLILTLVGFLGAATTGTICMIFYWPTGLYYGISMVVGLMAGIVSSEKLVNRLPVPLRSLGMVGPQQASTVLSSARTLFQDYQSAWSRGDSASIRLLTTPSFGDKSALLLEALAILQRVNQMDNVRIRASRVIDSNAEGTVCTVLFRASAKDTLIDTPTGSTLYKDSSTFTEYWRLVKNDTGWLVDGIDQSTADVSAQRVDMIKFATDNKLFYCLDMGWLFLPSRGKLFGKGKFGVSDINNYVVGKWGSYLVQFYTYKAYGSSSKPIVISQLAVPKSYGGILIQPKKLFGNSAPDGYTKYEFEWPDFNKRYDVYATDADRLATFELLNPGFMAYLYDTDEHVSIEVVDTIIYLYKTGSDQTIDYQTVLTILQKAYKELQL